MVITMEYLEVSQEHKMVQEYTERLNQIMELTQVADTPVISTVM